MTNLFLTEITRKDLEDTIKHCDNDDLLIISNLLIKRACELNKETCTKCLFNHGVCRRLSTRIENIKV